QQLEPPFERREQLDLVAEHEARMRPEGDDGRHRADGASRFENHPVSPVDAVEAPDRDHAWMLGKLVDGAGDDHSRASASPGGMTRSGSASSTEKGPISSRRS